LGAGRQVGWRSRYEFTETKLGSRMAGPKKTGGRNKKAQEKNEREGKKKLLTK
jgi:hypothetical protein